MHRGGLRTVKPLGFENKAQQKRESGIIICDVDPVYFGEHSYVGAKLHD